MDQQLTPRLEAVLNAYNAIAKSGEKPRALDIANQSNITGKTDKDRAANVYNALGVLRKRGLVDASTRTASPVSSPSHRTPPRSVAAAEPKPTRALSSDPTVAALLVKRDEFRRKADALDVAIDLLSESRQ